MMPKCDFPSLPTISRIRLSISASDFAAFARGKYSSFTLFQSRPPNDASKYVSLTTDHACRNAFTLSESGAGNDVIDAGSPIIVTIGRRTAFRGFLGFLWPKTSMAADKNAAAIKQEMVIRKTLIKLYSPLT